jgi:hypothetical protein
VSSARANDPPMLVDEIRSGAAWVARQARHVVVETDRVAAYAAAFPPPAQLPGLDAEAHVVDGPAELRAAFFLTLDAINFGSGWFPTIRKRDGRSGYFTIALGLRDRFRSDGAWSAEQLRTIDAATVATTLGQDPEHELVAHFARALNDLGAHVADEHGGRFLGVVEAARGSAPALVELLAAWDCFDDRSSYGSREIPLFKRAQVATSDLALAGAARLDRLDRLTLFADNLIPHVLRLDGVLRFDPALVARIEAGELIEHDAPEEVEMRAGAIHVAELICRARPDLTPQLVDGTLWTKGGGARYKAVPRPRSRSTAY